MRYSPEHKQEARTRILKAAGRGFRKHGYGGIGVDGLAREAGVTSGAFYGHFSSKDLAFRQSLVAGLIELREAVKSLKMEHGANWISVFVDFYLSERLTCDLGEACALQALTGDVVRASPETKAIFHTCMEEIVAEVADGLPGGDLPHRQTQAWALLSFLSGVVTTLRALGDTRRTSDLAQNLRGVALSLVAAAP